MATLTDCGCQTKVYGDGSGVEIYFCSVHREAFALLAVCKLAVRQLRARLIVASPWGADLVEKLEKVIEDADNGPDSEGGS